MAEENTIKTKRDLALERFQQRYPDREFADDEAMWGQVNDDYADYDNQINGYRERESQMANMFAADPRSARFLMDWKNGGDPVIMLVRQFGTDIKEALEDPDKLDAIAEANKEYVERVAKEKELDEQYKANVQQSLADMEAYQAEKALADEDIDNAFMYLKEIANNVIMGKFTKDMLEMAGKALNHDADVAVAAEDGEVKGRNAKIEERMRQRGKGDGVAALDGANNVAKVAPKKDLGALNRYDPDMQNIWERGGENRKKRTVFD
jgi:hypothetical protein